MRFLMLFYVILLINCGKGTSDQYDDIDTVVKPIDTSNIDLSSSIIGIRFLHTNIKGSECERLTHQRYDLSKHIIFSSIKLCSIKKKSEGGVDIIYADSSGFSFEDVDRDIMVEIPKIYVKREIKEGYEYIYVSSKEQEGFKVDPAFIENGKILKSIFVGVYDGTVVNNQLRSISSHKPTSGLDLNKFRDLAKNNGRGFGLFDARSVMLLQKLFMIYYADRNSQNILGAGVVDLYWQTANIGFATESFEKSNKITLGTKNIESNRFKVGQICAIAPNGEYWMDEERLIQKMFVNGRGHLEIEFSGKSVNIASGVSKIYGQAQLSGGSNFIIGKNGNSNLFGGMPDSGLEYVKFLYLENLWGNVWNLLDGIILYNLEYYVGNNMDDYTSDFSFVNKYSKLSYTAPLQDKNNQDELEKRTSYVSSLGYDDSNPIYALPCKIGEGASPNSGYCDPFYSRSVLNQIYIPAFGGGFDHSYRSGLFTYRFFWKPEDRNRLLHGARLIYKNL